MGLDCERWNFRTFDNFAGFVLLERCLRAAHCTEYYGFKMMTEEQGLLIQQKKVMDAAGIEPKTSRWRPTPKTLNHEDLYILMASFFHLAELASRSQFWLNLHHSRLPEQTYVMSASRMYEPGATKLLFFFFNSGLKNAFSLSLHVKCDQQTHKKHVSNYGINLKKIIQQSPITIAGEFTHNIEAFFAGFDSPIRFNRGCFLLGLIPP